MARCSGGYCNGMFKAVVADVREFEYVQPRREHDECLEVTTCYRPCLLGEGLGLVGTLGSNMNVAPFSGGKRVRPRDEEAAL
jgi:hypothetical protein